MFDINEIQKYGKYFIMGGILLSSIKYVSTTFGPDIAPIVSTLPLGIIFSYFILENGKKEYFSSYLVTSSVLFFCMIFMNIMIYTNTIEINILSFITLCLWFLLSYMIILYKKN